MARHVPSRFIEKVRRVREIVDATRSSSDGVAFDVSLEVAPGVRVVRGRALGKELAFSLWTYPIDIAELCGDGAVPATAAALLVHRDDARRLQAEGVFIDLSQLVRSESYPGYYYALFDHASPLRLRRAMTRLAGSARDAAARVCGPLRAASTTVLPDLGSRARDLRRADEAAREAGAGEVSARATTVHAAATLLIVCGPTRSRAAQPDDATPRRARERGLRIHG
jgi:hypothetical protein